MDKDLERLFYELNKDPEISDNLIVLTNTIEATKRFNLKALLKKAYKNIQIRNAFDSNKEGLVIHFKLNGTAKKAKKDKLDVEQMDLVKKVKAAVDKIYPGKFKTFADFIANIAGTKFFNVVCF